MTYHRDGRPRAIAMDASTLGASCMPVPKILAMLALADPDVPVLDRESQVLVVPLQADAIVCADAETARVLTPAPLEFDTSESLTPPRKVKDVPPVYPQAMVNARRSGLVIVRSTISATGCVSGAEVARSVELPLDVAALNAVTQWRFTPTLVDGQPVPLAITVTLGFRLQ